MPASPADCSHVETFSFSFFFFLQKRDRKLQSLRSGSTAPALAPAKAGKKDVVKAGVGPVPPTTRYVAFNWRFCSVVIEFDKRNKRALPRRARRPGRLNKGARHEREEGRSGGIRRMSLMILVAFLFIPAGGRLKGERACGQSALVITRCQSQSNAGSLGGGARRSRQPTAGNRCL